MKKTKEQKLIEKNEKAIKKQEEKLLKMKEKQDKLKMKEQANIVITEEQAKKELEKNYDKAHKVLIDDKKSTDFVNSLGGAVNVIDIIVQKTPYIITFIDMVKSYIKKEYTAIPYKTITAIVGALIYLLNAIDFIPDVIPILGHIDDIAILAACYKLVEEDVIAYQEWKKNNIVIE